MASYIESLFKGSLTIVVDSSLNVFKELAKFLLILLIVYHFTIWSFQFWDDILQRDNGPSTVTPPDIPDILAEFHDDVKKTAEIIKNELKSNEMLANDNLKIETTKLIGQLEIEAEFEQHQAKLNKSEAEFEDEENIAPKKEELSRNDTAESSNPNGGTRTQSISFDDQYDHESFHRA